MGRGKGPSGSALIVVASAGVVRESELPEGVGLQEVSSTGQSLRTVRKAPHRAIDPPINLLAYLLIARSTETPDTMAPPSREVRIRRWNEATEGGRLASGLRGKKIREALARVTELEYQLQHSDHAQQVLESVLAWIEAHGGNRHLRVIDQLERLCGGESLKEQSLMAAIKLAVRTLSRATGETELLGICPFGSGGSFSISERAVRIRLVGRGLVRREPGLIPGTGPGGNSRRVYSGETK